MGGGIVACSLVSTIAILLTSWLIHVEGKSYPLLLYAGPIYLLGVFYMLGIWLRKHEDTSYFRIGLLIAVTGYLLQILECSYYMKLNGGGLGIKISSAIFSTGIILMLVSKRRATLFKETPFTRAIAWIGEVSFGVYLLHVYVIFILHTIFGGMPWVVGWGLAFVWTIAILFFTKRMFPEKFTYKFLGF